MPGEDDGLIPSVEPQVTPSAEIPMAASPQAMGVAIGQATEQMGMVAARVGYDQKVREQHIAQIAAQDGAHAVIASDQDALHGKDGIMYREAGIGAPKMADDYLTQRSAKVAQVRDALPSDEARKSFDLHESMQSARVKDQLGDWQHQQINKADASSLQTSSELHMSEAIIGAGEADPQKRNEVINTSIAKGSMAIIDYGQRHGWDKDRTDLAVKEYGGSVVTNVVKALVDTGEYGTARDFYADHGEDVTGQQSIQVSQMLKVSGEQDESRKVADSIINRTRTDGEPQGLGGDIAALEARKITNTKVYDQAKQRILENDVVQRKIRNDDQQARLQSITDAFEDPANVGHDIPPSLLVGADAHVINAANTRQKQLRQGDIAVTDPAVYKEIQDRLSNPETWKDELGDADHKGSLDLNVYKPFLSPAHFTKIEDEIKTTRQKIINRDETLSHGQVATEVTNRLFKENGLDGAKKGTPAEKTQAAAQGRFLLQFHSMLGAIQVSQSKAASPEQVDEVAKKLFAETTWQDPIPKPTAWSEFWSKHNPDGSRTYPDEPVSHTAPAYTRPGAEKVAYSIHDIPKDYRDKQARFDEKHGKRTDAERVDDYNAVMLKPQAP